MLLDTAAPVGELADELVAALSRVRRAVRRAAPPAFGPLTGSQVELLRLVRTEPGTSVAEAATRLRLAANTVSTLVGQLVDAGMLVREPDPADRRVARLRVTRQAGQRIDAWRTRRSAAVATAVAALGPDERERLRVALPVLAHLTDALEEE